MPYYDCEPQQNPVGLVQLLNNAGYDAHHYRVRRRIRIETRANPLPCFSFSGWATNVQATHGAVTAAILASLPPPNPVAVINARNVGQTGPARQTLAAAPSLAFFEECERLIMAGSNQPVADIVDLLIIPEFFRKHPAGRVAYVAANAAWGDRAGTLRGLAATDFMSWAWARQGGRVAGFPMLRSYHGGATVSFDKWLAAYLALTIPQAECVTISRNPGHLVFILDTPANPIGRPASDWEVLADPYSLVAAARRGGGRRSLVRRPLGAAAASTLVEDGIADVNAAFGTLTAPENYQRPSGRCNFAGMALGLVQFDRITLEVGIAATTPHHFLRKLFGFAVADKLAAAGLKRAREIKGQRLARVAPALRNRRLRRFSDGLEPELFSGLLTDAAVTALFADALLAARNQTVAALAPTIHGLQHALSTSVLAGIWLPQARRSGRVRVRYRNPAGGTPLRTRSMSEQEYVADFLRQMRNTHHGYGLHQQMFERLLACHTGEFGDEAADLGLLFWHAAVQCPALVTHGNWVEGLTLRRTTLTP